MKLSRAIMIAALVLYFSGAANAETLYSPPMFAGASNRLRCQVVNVSKKTLPVTIEIWGDMGTVLLSLPDLPVPAGWAVSQESANGPVSDTRRYCRFTAKRAKRSIRAAACIVEGTSAGSLTPCKWLVEAR